MATTPATMPNDVYGIETTVTGITIESESITTTPVVEPVPDQKNATTKEIKYDERTDLKVTYRGAKLTVTAGTKGENDTITYNGVKYYIDSHEDAGTYNGLHRYNLSAHRFTNAPAGN